MNILIVDDEIMIREWLIKTISSLPIDTDVVHGATDGVDALYKLSLMDYDVILIDIQMPRMDGISLLKELQGNRAKKIVLSSHNQFEYAREAFKYDVSDYILKNECTREKLVELLKPRTNTKVGQNAITVKSFIDDEISSNPYPKLSEKYVLSVVFQTQAPVSENFSSFEGVDEQINIGAHENCHYCLFSLCINPAGFDLNNFLKYIYDSTKLTFGCSRLYLGAGHVRRAVFGANLAVNRLFYSHDPYIVEEKWDSFYDIGKIKTLSDIVIQKLREYDRSGALESLHILNSYISDCKPGEIDVIKSTYYNIVSTALLYFTKNPNITLKLESFKTGISATKSHNELVVLVDSFFKTGYSSSDELTAKYSSHVKSAIEYIELNFRTISSALDIARHVYLNPDYFTRLFKKETGVPVVTYLLNYRLEIASQLLKHSQLSITEICEKVGFNNMSYFSKRFKEYYGVQPNVYRLDSEEP